LVLYCTDYFGAQIREDLSIYGVSLKYLGKIEGNTGITIAIIDPNGERTFYSYRGVNATGKFLNPPLDLFSNQRIFHISGYSFQDEGSRNNLFALMKEARKQGASISLDPSYWFSKEYHLLNPNLLLDINIIFPNKEEAKILSGINEPIAASHALLEMGPEIVIIKLGQEGCYISSKKESYYLPGFQINKVVDTTGAGDAFCGGFLAGHILGFSIKDSAKIGNIVASRIIGFIGGHKGALSLKELEDILILNNENELAEKISKERKRLKQY